MSRLDVQSLKLSVRAGAASNASETELEAARASTLALLDRSIRCGHRRLAIHRLAAAIQIGAPVSNTQWTYCSKLVSSFKTEVLRNWAVGIITAAASASAAEIRAE